ncbi:MAG: hypothetical protein JRE10_11605 [Deltaproteobacteria bacterium]|nr:hypothetical protein [Deltaproteobacteria bacterium]
MEKQRSAQVPLENKMNRFLKTFCCLVVSALVYLSPGFLSSAIASNEPSLLGNEVPLINGAIILKERAEKGVGRFELEVETSPEEVARFYKKAMVKRGWPSAVPMSVGNQSILMLNYQGNKFILKAESKNGRTRVLIVLIRQVRKQAATEPLPSAATANSKEHLAENQSQTAPPDRGKTIKGAPPAKGAFVQRIQNIHAQDSPTGKKNSGSPPDDPAPRPENSGPESKDSSDSSDAHAAGSADMGNGKPERLSVTVRAVVRWNVTQPEYHEYEGLITLQFNGTLKSDATGSPSVHKAGQVLKPILTYKPEVMTLSYTYDERKTSLKPIPDGKCQDPLIFEFHGGGVSPIGDSAGLKIQQSAAMAAPFLKNLSADKQQFLAALQGSMSIPDYYEFYVGGPGLKKRIPGRKKDSSKEGCAYTDVEKILRGCQVGIQMKLPKSGTLQGSRTWSADDQGLCPPSLGIYVSDIAQILKKPPLKPTEGGNKNVTYTVSWQIRKAEEYIPVTESTDKEKPCEVLEKRINTIRIIRKIFQNKKLQRYCEEKFGKQDYKAYNDILEKTAQYIFNQEFETYQDASDFIDDLDPNQIQAVESGNTGEPTTYMKTNVLYDTRDNHVVEVKLMGYLNGKPVPIMEFPNGDVGSARKTGYYDQVRNAYDLDYYQSGTGRSMFDSQVKHEMTHVRQYLEKGYRPESIKEFSAWEQEAYKNELDELLQDYKDAGC